MPTTRITPALALLILTLGPALAQEPRSAVPALNQALADSDKEALSKVFTADADFRIGRRVVASGAEAIAAALLDRSVWSEVSRPRIAKESIRALSPDIALVDAEQVRYGSMINKETSAVILLLKRTGDGWRIHSMRIFPEAR